MIYILQNVLEVVNAINGEEELTIKSKLWDIYDIGSVSHWRR